MGLDEFLETMSGQIRSSKARIMARQEMEDHIRDQAEAYEDSGMTRTEAMDQAIRQMGDPVTAGVELDRIHRPKMEWRLFTWIILFSILGLVIQYVCFYGFSQARPQEALQGSMGNFMRQCVYTAIGLGVMAMVCLCDYSMIGRWAGILGGIFLGTVWLACKSGVLGRINGSYPYLKCLTYLFVPLYAGILYRNRGKGYMGLGVSVLWIWMLMLIGIGSIGGGIGVTIDALLACGFLLFVAAWQEWFGLPRKAGVGLLMVFLITAVSLFVIRLAPYQLSRIQMYLHPGDFENTGGYQIVNIRNIVSNLSFNGSSYGVLEQKGLADFLRNLRVYSEFMILQTAVTLGVMKTACVCVLFALFLMHLFRMAVRQKNQLGRMMGLGCTLVLTMETVRNMLSNFGIGFISTGGVPFFSYGKWHTLVVYILFGVLLSIYRHENLVWDEPAAASRERGVIGRIGAYVIRVEKRDGRVSQ